MKKLFVWMVFLAMMSVAGVPVLRGEPMVIMSYDCSDWSMKPAAIDIFLDVLKTTGFGRVHWRVAQFNGFFYRSRDAAVAASRLDDLGGSAFDPLGYGVQAGNKRGIQVYSYVDLWENMGFLGKWGEEHPNACMMTRGGARWTGGISYAYPEGRAYRLIPVRETAQLGVDGVYLENWSWHGGGAPSFRIGFEPPVAQRYKEKYGVDILTQPFELVKLKEVQGEFLRQFLVEAKKTLEPGQRLAFSYAFSQASEMYHLPILDLKGLVSDKIIDDLILGVWFGTDYECWLTQEGWDKAKEWSDFCHKNNAKFFAYIYTDVPYVVAWERFGAPGVRSRWRGDHNWLANTGVDGFTNRNVPESICGTGAPGNLDGGTISKYLVPVAEQLWSGAAEGIKAKPGSLRPLWTPDLPKNAPAVLVLMPAAVKKMNYPLPHQADYWPETYKGMARQYRTLFANLGCRMELADTQAKLEAALARPKDYLAIVPANQCWNELWVKQWLEQNSPQLLDYVKGGGNLITLAGFDSPIARTFGLSSDQDRIMSGTVCNIPQGSLPVEMRPFLPGRLVLTKNIGGYVFRSGGQPFPDSFAPSAYNPAKMPAWAVPVATLPGSDGGREWPVVVAGSIGKGKVVCTTTFLLANEMVAINPSDGPDVPEVIRFWQAIGHYLQPGRKLPIDRAMAEQDRRFAQMAENPLANGGFEDGWLMGHPAYWMAEGKQAGTWIKDGQGVSLDRRDKAEGRQSLCLDIARVASLTSLTFPVRPDTAYILSGKMKAGPQTAASVRVCTRSGSAGDIQVKSDNDWTDFRIKLKPISKSAAVGFQSSVPVLWVEVSLPGADGKIWLDDFRIRMVK